MRAPAQTNIAPTQGHYAGGQIAAELKADPQFAKTPIVFLTAAVDKEEVRAKKGLIGGLPFIAKPLHVKSIIQVIEANLAAINPAMTR